MAPFGPLDVATHFVSTAVLAVMVVDETTVASLTIMVPLVPPVPVRFAVICVPATTPVPVSTSPTANVPVAVPMVKTP